MNVSTYIFGKLLSGYTQYPDDNKKILFKSVAADSIQAKSMIAIRRNGNLVHYIYLRLISSPDGDGRYLGLALELNDVYCNDLSKLFMLFDEALTRIVLNGKIVEFNDDGDIVAKASRMYYERTEIDRISNFLSSAIENIPTSSFKKLPPVNYSITANEVTILTESASAIEVAEALKVYHAVNVYRDKDTSAIDEYSKRIKKLSQQIASLDSDKSKLSLELSKVKRQKKRTTVVTILSLTVAIVVIIFISVGTNLSDKVSSLSSKVNSLKDLVNEKDETIDEQTKQIKDYTIEIKSLNTTLKTTQKELESEKSEKKAILANNTELERYVSTLTKQKNDLESQISNLSNQLKSKNSHSTSVRTVYSKEFSMKVGERVVAKLPEGKITRWEVDQYRQSNVQSSEDILTAVNTGKISIWGYINDSPKLFTVTIK